MVSANSFVLMAILAAAPNAELWEFSAPWCGSCKTMDPVVRQLADEGVPVRQISVDDYGDLARQAKVTGVPCFVVVADGKVVDRKVGVSTKQELRAMFDSVATASKSTSPPYSPPVIRGQQAPRRPFGRITEAINSLTNRGGPTESANDVAPVQPPSLLAPAETPRLAPFLSPNTQPRNEQPTPTVSPTPPWPQDSQASPQPPPASGSATPVRRAMDATVRLRVEDPDGVSLGTGTIVHVHNDEALVLTCGHIFRDSNGKGAVFCDLQSSGGAQRIPGRLVQFDLQRDIGLVSFRPGQTVHAVNILGPGYTPRVGDPVFAVGCNQGAAASVIENKILNVNRYHGPANLVVGGRPIDGRSGGGLFSHDGSLMGVCNAADPAADEGLYAALGPIHAVLDKMGLDFVYQDSPPQPDMHRSQAAIQPAAHTAAIADDHNTSETEVICIVRPKNNRSDPGKAYVLDKPSKELLGKLSEELGSRGPHQFTDARLNRNPK